MKTMKRNSLVSLGLIGIMTLAISGCNGFEEQKLPEPSTKGNFVIMVTPETKTEMSENEVVWSENDTLNVFVAENGTTEYGGNVEFTHDSGEKFTGDLTLPSSSNDWYVLYPYNSEITTPDNTSTGATRIGSAVGSYQEQNGNNSSAHLVGQYFPLYGKTTAVPSAQVPAITLNQALSILKVHVTNKTAESLTVNEVSFTGTEAIAGSFYINFTGENAVMTPVDGSSSNTAILKVKNGAALATDASADFYLAIKPFTATSGSTLTLAVNGYEKTIELTKDASFKEGKIRTLNYDTPTEFPPLLEDWVETALSDINSGDVFVMVGNGTYAVNNTLNTSTGGPKPVPVTIDETKAVAESTIVGAPADSIKWTLTGNNTDGYIFYSYADGNNFLYCSTEADKSSNDNLRVGPTGSSSTQRNLFVLDGDQLKTNDGYVARYIGINGTSDFRGYVSASTSSVTFKFYKQDSKYAEAYAITVDPGITGGTVSTDPAGTQYEGQTVTLTATPTTGIFTSWDVYKTDDSSVKISVENDQFTMPGYPVTVSAVFGEASLTVSGTTPEKAECTAGSEVTFTVTSNVAWTASSESAIITSISPAGAQDPSTEAQTVTVTLAANSGAERTATVSVNPVDQEHYSAQNKTVTVTQKQYVATLYYEKVTTAPSDWSGDYLMVCESRGEALSSISTTSTKYGIGTGVTISDGKILSNSTTNAYKLVIAPATGGGSGYTIKFGDNYLYWTSGNSLATNASESDNSRWTITAGATTGNWVIANVNDSAREIWYNTGSPRFACYTGKSESTSGYAAVQLYRLEDNTPKYTVTIDGNIENGTVTASAASVAEGTTVTLTVTPDAGYELDELTVYKTGDASTTVSVSNNTFSMPAYGVTVTATFAAVPTMNVIKTGFSAPAAAGTYTETGVYELLNGASDDDVEAIADGDVVTDVEWENGDLIYTVSANTGAAREGTILISYDGGEAEEITVSQAAATYQLTLTAPGSGYSITATVGGVAVATATTTDQNANVVYGSTVTLSATAPSGYTLDEWTVTGATLSGNQFTMTGNVTVSATFVSGKDGKDPANPYTVAEALEVISHYASGQGGTDSVYVSGIVVAQGTLYNTTRMTYFISDDGTSTDQLQVFRGWYIGGAAFSSVDQLAAGSTVVVYGQLFNYSGTSGTTPEINTNNRLYSVDGYTSFLTLDTFTVTTDNTDSKKDITVQWAASGSANPISYTVTCAKKSDGTESQSYNASAAGSHTFSVSSYDTDYTITVTATADGAIGTSKSKEAKVADPGTSTKDYYKLVTNISDITAGTYVVGALRSQSPTNNFYFGKATVNSGDWVVSDTYVTVAAVDGVRRFETSDLPTGAVEFTFTGDNTNGFTISNSSKYLYYTASSNRKLAFAAAGSSQKWTVGSHSSPLVTGGVYLSAVGGTYTITENSTATGAIRGYASTTKYRAIYLFKKVNE